MVPTATVTLSSCACAVLRSTARAVTVMPGVCMARHGAGGGMLQEPLLLNLGARICIYLHHCGSSCVGDLSL